VQTTPANGFGRSVTLATNQTVTGQDFGERYVGVRISGNFFEDLNGNGKRDSGETGLGGWVVYVDRNGNGVLDSGEPSTTSLGSGSGSWELTGLAAGTNTIRFIHKTGWHTTTPWSYTVTLAAGQTKAGLLFGEQRVA
jgi:hypothetical protein